VRSSPCSFRDSTVFRVGFANLGRIGRLRPAENSGLATTHEKRHAPRTYQPAGTGKATCQGPSDRFDIGISELILAN